MKKQRTKKQHYVPRFYLNGFIDDDLTKGNSTYLWMYKNKLQEANYPLMAKPTKISPSSIAYKNHLYTINEHIEEPDILENALSVFESDARKVFNEISNYQFDFNDKKKWYIVGRFVSFLCNRTLQSFEDIDILYSNIVKSKIVSSINRDGMELFLQENGITCSEDELLYLFNTYKFCPNQALKMKLMVGCAAKMISSFCIRNWTFLTPEDDDMVFITSDNPVLLLNPHIPLESPFKPGLLQKETAVLFPVTPRICLHASLLKDYPDGYFTIVPEFVSWINQQVVNLSKQFWFSSTKKVERMFISLPEG